MYTKRQKVNIDDTRFIFTTNFSGDPERDRFGSDQRRVNVVIPTEELAQHLLDLGVKVKQTKPNPERTYDEPFVPTLYVPVNIKMDSKWPPHVYWITLQGKRTSIGSQLLASACSATRTPSASWTSSVSRTSACKQISLRRETSLANTVCTPM